ncbi:hypothetical protein DL769_008376 [Monosporascus sp. CRB-8-3]|nr:hypothetical protein DL769_008376 [Monosporascus sp. CRB-8-3]
MSVRSVSFCAALGNLSQKDKSRRTSRYLTIAVFAILYLAFSITFGKALGQWDYEAPGRCYVTGGITPPTASPPQADRLYLGITCFYLFFSLILSVLVSSRVRITSDAVSATSVSILSLLLSPTFRLIIAGPDFVWGLTFIAMLQYPLHLYTVVTLRISNRDSLGGDSEDSWSFGQIVALTLLGFTVTQCIEGIWKYRSSVTESDIQGLIDTYGVVEAGNAPRATKSPVGPEFAVNDEANLTWEARVMELISEHPHPHIIGYYGYRVRRGRITGLVLDRHPSDLKNYVKHGIGTIDEGPFMEALESPIHHLHPLGWAHNDLNPGNILVDKSGMPVLIDFGSSHEVGKKLTTSRGTKGWIDEDMKDYTTSEKGHDTSALKKIRAW